MLTRTRRNAMVLAIVLGALAGSAEAAPIPRVPATAEPIQAGMTLWYCKVTYYAYGKKHISYLGGYVSEAVARKQYRNWALGVGGKAKPQLLKVWSE